MSTLSKAVNWSELCGQLHTSAALATTIEFRISMGGGGRTCLDAVEK